jgi:pimeloyl-ACP methyl ester carboxylesterase
VRYESIMARKRPVGDIVVLLPGILGSVLQRDGKDVWSITVGAAWRGLMSMGKSIKSLELHGDDPVKADLGDGVVATRLMPDVHLAPGLWKIEGYTKIREVLHSRFELEPGVNWFDFPYDWRRDNRAAAHRLAESVPAWLDAWRKKSGNDDAKVVLVGHSMGGLVARYYLEALDGWKDARALVTFGTPYRGSLNAVDFAANGFVKSIGPFKLNLSSLLQSMPSVHQLMPVYPCIDDGSGSLVRVSELTTPPDGVDMDKVRAAAGFHDEIVQAVDRNGGYGRYDIHPVVGIFQKTRLSASLRDGKLKTLYTYEGDDHGGDGTVPRPSATPIELSDTPQEMYATQAHSTLQNVDQVLIQLMGILSRQELGRFRASPFEGFSLEFDDLLEVGEPLEVTVTAGGAATDAVVTVTDVDSHTTVEQSLELEGDEPAKATFAPLPAGIYRVTVSDTEEMAKPVTDLVVVASDDAVE